MFFRGSIAPRAEEFSLLSKAGIVISLAAPGDGEFWALKLTHPQWGDARVSAPRQTVPIPKPLLVYDSRLEQSEVTEALLGRSSVIVSVDGAKGDILRDRKRMLCFLNAVMGDDGLIALDFTASRFWSRAALADELCHDADLDIDSLFTIHAITTPNPSTVEGATAKPANTIKWFHTHGLSEIGFFDFDIVRPSSDLLTARCHDFARATAFLIVEGKVKASTPVAKISSAGPLRLVDVAEFNRRASSADRALRDVDEFHNRNRTVLCDTASGGLLSKLFGARAVPSRMLSGPQGDFMVFFSKHASRLMTQRAKATYERCRGLAAEFEQLKVKPIVKLGFKVDGTDSDDLEHLWFEVNKFMADKVDATLLNKPNHVSKISQGQRAVLPLDMLSDWMLIGPTGSINPRDTRPARSLRVHREKIVQILNKSN